MSDSSASKVVKRLLEVSKAEILDMFPEPEKYEGYTLPIATDLANWEPVLETQEEIDACVRHITQDAKSLFPGIEIQLYTGLPMADITGPDPNVCEAIRQWIDQRCAFL